MKLQTVWAHPRPDFSSPIFQPRDPAAVLYLPVAWQAPAAYPRKWTDAELSELRRRYPHEGASPSLCALLRRPRAAVAQAAQRMGLHITSAARTRISHQNAKRDKLCADIIAPCAAVPAKPPLRDGWQAGNLVELAAHGRNGLKRRQKRQ